MNYEATREQALLTELRLHLAIMANRDASGDPLRCDEMICSVPRDKLRELLGLAVETLIRRQVVDADYKAMSE